LDGWAVMKAKKEGGRKVLLLEEDCLSFQGGFVSVLEIA